MTQEFKKDLFVITLGVLFALALITVFSSDGHAQQAQLSPQEQIERIDDSINGALAQLQFIDNQLAELLTKRQKLNQQIGVQIQLKGEIQRKIKEAAKQAKPPVESEAE